MPTRNVDLTEQDDRFIDNSIATGRFSNASEAVRAGLQLLEREEIEDQAKLEWLRGAAQEAFDSLDRGEGKTYASVEELSDHIRHLGSKASAAVSGGSRRS